MNKYLYFIRFFIKENKNYIYTSIFVFFLWICLYLLIPVNQNFKHILIQQTLEYMKNIITTNNFDLFIRIFLNNVFVWFLIVLSGFLLSIFWIFLVLWNIFIVWVILTISIEKVGVYHSLLAILPHWILEISAILLSLSLSFKITYLIIKKIWNWKNIKVLWEFKRILLFFVWFVLPLFLIAAFVESFITPLFLR